MRILKNLLVALPASLLRRDWSNLFAQHPNGQFSICNQNCRADARDFRHHCRPKIKFRAVTKDPSGRTTPASASALVCSAF